MFRVYVIPLWDKDDNIYMKRRSLKLKGRYLKNIKLVIERVFKRFYLDM